jgi:hypothetical protein
MNKAERQPWPLTDEYARQILIRKGFDNKDITPQMIELQKAKIEDQKEIKELS